jgi:hypothetical protein
MQNNEQIISIWTDWKNFDAPKNLIDTEQTSQLLADYIAQNFQGVVSRTALNAAVTALASKVVKQEPTKAERDAKQAAKQYLDTVKNKPGRSDRDVQEVQRRNAEDATSVKKAAEAKELATIKAEIAREISSYVKGHPSGHTDYSRTEDGQTKLRAVAANYNQLTSINAVKTVLESVRAAKQRLS